MTDVLAVLRRRGLTLAVAESDTGGLLLEQLTAIAGSSRVVLGGVVAYHDSLKVHFLGVEQELLRRYGAVSAEVADAMAVGVRTATGAHVGVATTGIAGPGGGTDTKPVGLAYVAATNGQATLVREHRWSGDRAANRAASVAAALALLVELIDK